MIGGWAALAVILLLVLLILIIVILVVVSNRRKNGKDKCKDKGKDKGKDKSKDKSKDKCKSKNDKCKCDPCACEPPCQCGGGRHEEKPSCDKDKECGKCKKNPCGCDSESTVDECQKCHQDPCGCDSNGSNDDPVRSNNGSCTQNGCSVKKPKCGQCISYLTVAGTGVVASPTTIADFPVLVMTWNDPPLEEALVCPPSFELVSSAINTQAFTGVRAKECGTFWVEYHTGLLTEAAATVILVNGNIVARSLSATLDFVGSEEPFPPLRVLGKSFLLRLQENDVVSVIVVPVLPTVIGTFPDASLFRYTNTLSLSLVQPCCLDCTCSQVSRTTDYITSTTIVSAPQLATPLVNGPQQKGLPKRPVLTATNSKSAGRKGVSTFGSGSDAAVPESDQGTAAFYRKWHDFSRYLQQAAASGKPNRAEFQAQFARL